MKLPRLLSPLAALTLASLLGLPLYAASIPGLFNTGVDEAGGLLPAGAVDPHFKLILSADTNFPGPDTLVVNQAFPIAGAPGGGVWISNGPLSKWIGPQADQTCCGQGNGGNEPGDYVYQIRFDLSGFDLSTVKITGQWATDSEGIDILLNGVSTGNKIAPYPPQPSESWHPFALSSGFVEGMNTLDFKINRSSGKYPTGLRAELSGSGVRLLQVPGLFNTGLDNNNAPLPTGATDPHYRLIASAAPAAPGPDTLVADFPGTGWMPNTAQSQWIAPQVDQRYPGGGSAPGDYVYRIRFDLSAFDVNTVKLTGQWAVDSEGVDILINGVSTGNKIAPYPPQPSQSWHPFTINSGFVSGTNTLDFKINRSSGTYPTGLRAEVSGLGVPLEKVADLFNSGVDASGALLAAGAVDPHYQLIQSADTNFPGPDTRVVNQAFPIAGEAGGGPWITNGPLSKWIAPQANQTMDPANYGGNEPGDYLYRTTFSLSGFDLSTVKITGQWAVDSEGVDILLNGVSTGNKIAPYPPQPSESWHPFTLSSGFVDGANTLDFKVNRSSGKYPTGLRAEMSGMGAPAGGGAVAPSFLIQPKSKAVQLGASVSFLVSLKGSGLSYQWRLNGTNIAGATGAKLDIGSVQEGDLGIYDVVVSNALGTVTSGPAALALATAIPGMFNSGVDEQKALLTDGAIDPHYKLIQSADDLFPGPDTFVVNEGAPVSPAGVWAANGPDSRWIAPNADQGTSVNGGDLVGAYVYRVTFDLSNLDPLTAQLSGKWAVTSMASDVLLNGKSTGLSIGTYEPNTLLRPFEIASGFVSGLNTLDFVVNAIGNQVTATGLRVELAGIAGAIPPNTAPTIMEQPQSQTVLQGRTATFTAAVRASAPLTYQWRLNGTNLAGATSATLTITNVVEANGGIYDMVASNAAGSATSQPAILTPIVIVSTVSIFPTGVDENQGLLADGAVDPHYKLISSADPNFPGPDAFVVNEASPISPMGPWLASGPASRWIAPQANQVMPDGGNALGDYEFRITFSLTNAAAGTVRLEGRWAVDAEGVNIRLNGTNTGWKIKPYPPQPSESWHPFTITEGFVVGVNTLDFLIHRSVGTNPTGLRAELQAWMVRPIVVVPPEAPVISGAQLTGGTLSLRVSTQPGAAYTVEYKERLSDATWTPLTTFTGDGNPKLVTDAVAGGASRFYRVRR